MPELNDLKLAKESGMHRAGIEVSTSTPTRFPAITLPLTYQLTGGHELHDDPLELPRGISDGPELVDSSTLPRLAVDNHSGLRWAAGNRARSDGAGCCKNLRCTE